jgi:SAM-dependent methyltransferase
MMLIASPSRTHLRSPCEGELLLSLLEELGGAQIEGRVVLDVGSGFGNVASYLAWRAQPAAVIATDIDVRLLEAGANAARELGLEDIATFHYSDMRELTAVDVGTIDVAIANGVLMYMPTGDDLDKALRELHRVVRPGGTTIVYQANKWTPRDPDTGRLGSHLRIGEKTGSGKRWVSALELHRRLRMRFPRHSYRRIRLHKAQRRRAATLFRTLIRNGRQTTLMVLQR